MNQEQLQQVRALLNSEVRVRVVKPSLGSTKLTIKSAQKEDARLIKKWIISQSQEAQFVGAKGNNLNASEIAEWIQGSIRAYLLYVDDTPVAFANIAPKENDLSELEVGRLLVRPDKRMKGYGSTLVRNLCLALTAAYEKEKILKQNVTLARVVRSNQIGHLFIKKLPFNEFKQEKEVWYRYHLDRRSPKLLGETMEKRRKDLDLSQASLAIQCGVQRAAINMIESGIRVPSVELLQSICRVLSPTEQYGRAKLLLAAIGEEPEENLRQYETVDTSITSEEQNLWVATDSMAEFEIPAYLENTTEAIGKGYDRFFFMPKGKWEEQGDYVKDQLQKKLSSNLKANVEKHFKFYEAPEWACCLRLTIENPESVKQRRAKVGGENYTRLPLAESQTRSLYLTLYTAIQQADSLADKGNESFVGEFRRRFPFRGGKSK
jgi:transcriptional regulator with XRE-family HTH domain/GNAT superfamily N-acetyltransferase